MGLDGGTYITRTDVLRGQSWRLASSDGSRSTRGGSVSSSAVYKEEQVDRETDKLVKWSTCSLSGSPLRPPIVSDFLGNLYNKQAVLEFLLGNNGVFESKESEHRHLNILRTGVNGFGHLKRSKDVFEVHGVKDKGVDDPTNACFVCPVTDLSCLRCPFSAIVTCGHMFSNRAIREMVDFRCTLCAKQFGNEDVIPINGTQEQRERLLDLVKSKKSKKSKSRKGDSVNVDKDRGDAKRTKRECKDKSSSANESSCSKES